MNKQRRASIEKLREQLSGIQTDLDDLLEEERESFDNLPESLQESDRGQAMQAAIDSMESALSSIEEADGSLEEALQ